jgi:hypothetical protein
MEVYGRVRIHKGVRPFGGRILEYKGEYTYPNGRKVIEVYGPIYGGNADIREYDPADVDLLPCKPDRSGVK